jgi:hypothetical protein
MSHSSGVEKRARGKESVSELLDNIPEQIRTPKTLSVPNCMLSVVLCHKPEVGLPAVLQDIGDDSGEIHSLSSNR